MIRTAVVVLLGVLMLAGSASAGGDFGMGIIAGEPTGVSGELWLTRSTAIDGAAAWSFGGVEDAFLIQSDYLIHNFSLLNPRTGSMAFYFGIGGRVKFADNPQAGIRFPLGLDYVFESAPVDIFGEIVPILDLVDKTELNFNGAIGARYFFGKGRTY